MVEVDDPELFAESLKTLKGRTHGDILAIFLAFKHEQLKLPKVGRQESGVRSHVLEQLLDDFYLKTHPSLGERDGQVWQIFSNSFKPRRSYDQNNWRDFFRYALGVGCLADEAALSGPFLAESRGSCPHLIRNASGALACDLHPIHTKYIRNLDKPKLLYWSNPGPRGTYKIVDLNDTGVLDRLRPVTARVPIDSLVAALYFGATWHHETDVSIERFATDFGFDGTGQVESLFAVEDDYRKPEVAAERHRIEEALQRPFNLVGAGHVVLTQTQRAVRLRAFTDAVRDAYDNSCAVCGLRVDTPDGKVEVQAAHIYPKRLSGADDVRNGIALCHNHHWAFDVGLFTVAPDYTLVWLQTMKRNALYVEGKLHLPRDRRSWPDQNEALAWHRSQFVDVPAQSN